ncbi:hypothetical protein Pelo_14490 [Pelomyxa schiedti]|nr:hypothetical protein Pelo_14490 [Pelomyxa schiedti]
MSATTNPASVVAANDHESWIDPEFVAEADAHSIKAYTAIYEMDRWLQSPSSPPPPPTVTDDANSTATTAPASATATATATATTANLRVPEGLTFPTEFIPLTLEDANTILAAQEVSWHGMKNEANPYPVGDAGVSLKSRIGAAVAKWPDGAFIRLSTRSPKDAVLNSPALSTCMQKELRDVPPGDENNDLVAFYRAVVWSMRLTNADQAWSLLVNSTRVHEDLVRWIPFYAESPMYIIIRKWHYIEPSNEFRCFVAHGRVTALSQYIDCCYFSDLAPQAVRDSVVRRVCEFFDTNLRPVLPFDHCVLDMCVKLTDAPKLERSPPADVTLIEINPFYVKTGPALFNWVADKPILTGVTGGTPPLRWIEDPEKRRQKGFGSVRDKYIETKPVEEPKKTTASGGGPCCLC